MSDRDRFGGAREPHFVRSFERGLAVIRAFDAEHPALTLSEVARTCELTRAAARRFLLTLVDLGYVHTDGRLFRLTPRVLELGYAYLSSFTLPDLAVPHLERLVAQVGESSSLCVLDGDAIVYVARVPTSRIMTATITVGTRFPAHVTSVGRVILAHLPDEEIDTRLARADLGPAHPAHPHLRRPAAGPSCAAYDARGTPSSTRSWRRGSGRSPPRSGTGTARWWPV